MAYMLHECREDFYRHIQSFANVVSGLKVKGERNPIAPVNGKRVAETPAPDPCVIKTHPSGALIRLIADYDPCVSVVDSPPANSC